MRALLLALALIASSGTLTPRGTVTFVQVCTWVQGGIATAPARVCTWRLVGHVTGPRVTR